TTGMPSSVEGLRLFLKGSASQNVSAIDDHSQPRNTELSRRNHAASGARSAELRQVLPFCPGGPLSSARRLAHTIAGVAKDCVPSPKPCAPTVHGVVFAVFRSPPPSNR